MTETGKGMSQGLMRDCAIDILRGRDIPADRAAISAIIRLES
jgi:hypothetical protein